MAGTAPSDAAFLFIEYSGSWGGRAVAESRLDEDVRAFLDAVPGVRVQLIRRHGRTAQSGVTVFAAHVGPRSAWVEMAVLADVRDVLGLDVAALSGGRSPGLTPYDDVLWLVCTNGRRDLCCADIGRPVTAALAAEWPEQTWETTHLGGHRFAGTLLALPSGVTLGRVDPTAALEACRDLASGVHPVPWSRGRVGAPGPAQVAELHLRAELGVTGLDDVRVIGIVGDEVTLMVADERWRVVVRTSAGAPRRQSCGDLKTKSAAVYEPVEWGRTSA